MKTPTRLVLTQPHTHAGKPHGPGEAIEVDAPTADWLLAHGIATADTATADGTSTQLTRAAPSLPSIHRKEPQP